MRERAAVDEKPAVIREAAPADYPRFRELFLEMASPLPPASREVWSTKLCRNSLALSEGDRLIGYILAATAPPRGHVSQLAVDPSARGRGHGLRLMIAMGRRMREAGCTEWALHVERNNLAALRLYQGLGLQEVHATIWIELPSPTLALLDPPVPERCRILQAERGARVVVDGDDALVERLCQAGGAIVYDARYMVGSLPGAAAGRSAKP